MLAPTKFCLAGLPNVLASDVVTITAGAEGADMLADNLKDWQHPSQQAELTSVFPHLSHWTMDAGPVPIQKVRVRGIGRYDSLSSGDQFRIVTVESGTLPDVRSETLAPTAVVDSDSGPGGYAISQMDEHPFVHDGWDVGTYITANPDGWFRLNFPDPSDNLAVGSDYQCFLLWVGTGFDPGDPEDYGTVRASLYENGVFVKDLGTKVVSVAQSADGQLLLFPWNASDLSDSSGVDVELRLDFTQGSTAIVSVDSVAWDVLHETDRVAVDSDTGWITITGAELDADFGNTAIDETGAIPRVYRKYSDDLTVQQMRVEFHADGLGYFNSFLQTPPRTPSTFIDAGYLICHPLWEAPQNFLDGAELDSIPEYVGDEISIDGSDHKVLQHQRRTFACDFGFMQRSKAEALFKRLNLAASGEDSLLLSMYPADANVDEGDLNTMLCTVERFNPQQLSNMSRDDERTSRNFGFLFVERLG